MVWSARGGYLLLSAGDSVWVWDVASNVLHGPLQGVASAPLYVPRADCLATEGEFVLLSGVTLQVVDGKTGQVRTVCTLQDLETAVGLALPPE